MALLTGATVAFAGTAALARPDMAPDVLRDRITALHDSISAGAAFGDSAAALIDRAGLREAMKLPPVAVQGFMPLQPAPLAAAPSNIEVQVLNMRLSLGMLAQSFGARNNFAVLQAQAQGRTDALVITRGTASLADLKLFMQHYRLQDAEAGAAFVARAPIVVLAGAKLRLGPGEVLNLSRPDGAFVVNFGHLDVDGGEINAVGTANTGTPSFRPFVVTGLQGTAQVKNARFSGLGFGQTLKFSGFSILRNALLPAADISFIRDSVFEDVRSVSIHSVRDLEITGNRFHNAGSEPLQITRAKGVQVTGNLFSGMMNSNAIKLTNNSDNAVIRGNVILGGEKAGISINTGSDHATVSNNIVWRRDGGGIRVARSNCGRVFDNIVMDNRQKGIEVRTSLGSEVIENLVASNKSAGIWVSAQAWNTNTVLRGNVLHENGAGLGTATAELITLDGNDFSGQFPQFLAGDLARQNRHIASDMDGTRAVILSADGLIENFTDQPHCGVY
ncbi:MAG: right-handed parallel beta-helix repeat-containing protein [Rhodobacteraceae bacterium]|nr:right-handed parallel beta-helix repeat-containing protein [Paracoccaceae bacterium]